MSTPRRVVIDVDVGTDDAMALLVLLHAEKIGLVKIEAIVCSMGNASLENVCKNTVRFLETAKRTDIKVYKGVVEPIISHEGQIPQFHGKDGFGDLKDETEPDLSIISQEPASAAVRKLVTENPKQITLVCVGPLTNLALTLKLYEDFAPNMRDLFIMGGNYAATGNIMETTEFNFYMDPEAAYITLNNVKCPITILTWETCLDTAIPFTWRWEVLGAKKSAVMNLITRAESNTYASSSPNDTWYPCDALLVIAILYPDSILKSSKHNATVELHDSKTRGQMVVDHLKQKEHNVIVVEKIDYTFVMELLLKAAEAV